MIPQIQLHALWNFEYDRLFEDLDKFVIEWKTQLKPCKCKNPECKHYQKEKWERFGYRINRLFRGSLSMNASTFVKIGGQVP